MAYQRPFLISLKRQDSHLRWGFGIKGGRDYGEPLVVQTVGEESLAEKFGLREGDEVIQVGRVNVQDLTLGQVHELLARCGNKIEMFVVREDLLSPRKGKEPQVVRTVVHNPYNSPISLYSTENIADTLAKQTEVLTEGHVSTEEDEGPENLSFQQKSAVFHLLEEQARLEGSVPARTAAPTAQVKKPTAAPPPPPKPKPPSNEQIFNGYDHQAYHQDQHKTTSRIEYQTSQKVVNQYQQEQPVQYQQQSTAYQYQKSPGYQSPPIRENVQAPVYQSSVSFQGKQSPTPSYQQQKQTHQQQSSVTFQGNQSPTPSYQQPKQTYQQQNQNYQQQNQNYQQSQGYQSSVNISQQQYPGYQSPTYKPLNQINYQQGHQAKTQGHQTQVQCPPQQSNYQQPKAQQPQSAVSKAEFKVGPPPPPRSAISSSTKQQQQQDSMTAVYKQQYEQHLQKQYEQQQQMLLNAEEEAFKPKAHIIEEDIFEHNCTSGTPITYKAPPAAPPKPNWPPPPPHQERFRSPHLESPPNGLLKNVDQVWPPKKSTAVEMPRTGFNPAAVREQGGSGRRCVWPPPSDEHSSGRITPQSPATGRRIQWNPSPSPPTTRRTTYSSPARRKDINWPPPAPTGGVSYEGQNGGHRPSPRMSRKAKFDDYIHEHASINVPQTYRPPPGTQHIEFR